MKTGSRTALALFVSPLIGGTVYVGVLAVASGEIGSLTIRDLSTPFTFTATVSFVFNVLVLAPAYALLGQKRRGLVYLWVVGVSAWVGLSISFYRVLSGDWISMIEDAFATLILGLPLVTSFLFIAGRQENA